MPQTIINLPQSNLSKNASFNSCPNPGPLALTADCQSLTCSLSMSAADNQDPTNVLTWTVYAAPPGAAPAAPPPSDGWTPVAQETWQGGTFVGKDGQTHPSLTTFTESVPPQMQGGWVAAAGQNQSAGALKVGVTVVANP